MGFNHDGYVENLVKTKPATRACEALETTRKLLGSPKRWTKGHLKKTWGDEPNSYCLHGALSRALRPKAEPGYVAEGTYAPALSAANKKEVNAMIALGLAIREHVKGNKWYASIVGDIDRGAVARAAYRFNDHEHTTHDDIKAVLKRARDICYKWALENDEK